MPADALQDASVSDMSHDVAFSEGASGSVKPEVKARKSLLWVMRIYGKNSLSGFSRSGGSKTISDMEEHIGGLICILAGALRANSEQTGSTSFQGKYGLCRAKSVWPPRSTFNSIQTPVMPCSRPWLSSSLFSQFHDLPKC